MPTLSCVFVVVVVFVAVVAMESAFCLNGGAVFLILFIVLMRMCHADHTVDGVLP